MKEYDEYPQCYVCDCCGRCLDDEHNSWVCCDHCGRYWCEGCMTLTDTGEGTMECVDCILELVYGAESNIIPNT